MLSAINVLRRHQWIRGQKDVRAAWQDTKIPTRESQTPVGAWRREGARLRATGQRTGLCSAIPKCWCRGGHLGRWATPGSPSTSPGFLLAAPSASAVVLSYWSSVSGWDNPRPLRGTVWPLINLGANPPFKTFPVNAKVGHYDLKYSSAHCPSTSFLNFGTLSCLCCWGTCYFFRDRAGSLVILALIGDKVQSKN